MVRLLLIIVVGLYSMSSNAQIEIFNESLKQEEPVKVVQYDRVSSSLFLKTSWKHPC